MDTNIGWIDVHLITGVWRFVRSHAITALEVAVLRRYKGEVPRGRCRAAAFGICLGRVSTA